MEGACGIALGSIGDCKRCVCVEVNIVCRRSNSTIVYSLPYPTSWVHLLADPCDTINTQRGKDVLEKIASNDKAPIYKAGVGMGANTGVKITPTSRTRHHMSTQICNQRTPGLGKLEIWLFESKLIDPGVRGKAHKFWCTHI